jgi:hypothetical protein
LEQFWYGKVFEEEDSDYRYKVEVILIMGTIIAGLSFILIWMFSYAGMSFLMFRQSTELENPNPTPSESGN